MCVAFWYFVINDEENPLDELPGPKRLPILGSSLEMLNIKSDGILETFEKFDALYGDRYIFTLSKLRVLHLSNPYDIEVVLSHSRNLTKSKPYNFVSAWLGDGLLLSKGQNWHKRRKILTPTFHFNILKNFTVAIDENCLKLVEKLKRTEGEEVDILPVILDFTLTTICETAMGIPMDSDKSQAIFEYKEAIIDMGHILINRLTELWLHIDFIFFNMPLGRRFKKSQITATRFADRVINERRELRKTSKSTVVESAAFGGKRRMAMLDLLLEAEENGEIDFDGIRDEVNTFMFAGHDTTAMALTFCLMLIADHDEVQERIFEECERVLGEKRSPTLSDLAELKYMEAVIKETLRLYPSVPFIGRITEEDFMLGDLLVRKGTELSVHIYRLHHREDLYPEPKLFKPERFLHGNGTKHPFGYVPFSAGPRNCIGQRFAMIEMKSALLAVCRNFKLVPRDVGWRPRLTTELVLRPMEPIYLKFEPRHTTASV